MNAQLMADYLAASAPKSNRIDPSRLSSRSTRDCRLHKNAKLHIRVPAPIALSSGRGTEAGASFEYTSPIRSKRVKSEVTPPSGRKARAIRKRQMAERKANLYRAIPR